MRNTLKQIVTMLLVTCIMITGRLVGTVTASAAAKPMISSGQAAIMKNTCTVKTGRRVRLLAKSGGKDVTKKCTWKSSKKSVAAVSGKGMLTAKKAGTAYITAKYKGKTSKKLKVVVENVTEPTAGNTSSPGNVSGDYTIMYDKNSRDKDDKLNGPATQSGSGEILKFSTTVTPANGKKFLGWYDAPTGGKRIYETYKPTGDMTLYAHYTDEDTQQVTFVLNCNYGDTYSFMSGRSGLTNHYRDFDWLKQEDLSGPMEYSDSDNIKWRHSYLVDDTKDTYAFDDIPVPSIPGYTFDGWYTADLERISGIGMVVVSSDAKKVEKGSDVPTGITRLYARFTKKLTISFDDLRGGKYDDIVVDTYSSIEDCGQKLPIPNIPGATFVGWTMDVDNHSYNWSKSMVTNDTKFLNCTEWFGFMCSGCGFVSKHMQDNLVYDEPGCDTGFSAVNDDYHVFEETDHVVLYPVYKYHRVDLSFDPKGGYFPYSEWDANHSLVFDDGITDYDYSHETVGVLPNGIGSQPYGLQPIPGHESDPGVDRGCWIYGDNHVTMPVVRRRNYVFDKWVYLDDAGNEQEFTYETILGKNMTVYAKWNSGTCVVRFDATDGTLTEEERNRVGLTLGESYRVTTESTIEKDGKQLPVPVSSEGRQFLGWFTETGDEFTADTQILDTTYVVARWGAKTDSKHETQKPAADKDTSANKNTDSSTTTEAVNITDITVTDMDWETVDKNSNKYTIEYGGRGNQTNLGFTATLLPDTVKNLGKNVIWTSSNPDIISVTAGKETIMSPNWFDYFVYGSDTGDVVLTVTSEDNPNVKFDIRVTVIKK